MRKMKRVEDSRTENTYLIMNKHINSYGRLFGGVLMQWIDEMAGIVAHRHAGCSHRFSVFRELPVSKVHVYLK